MKLSRALWHLLMMGHFWAGARRAWLAFHEMALVWGGLEAAEGLAKLARGRTYAMGFCLREWLYELRRAGCFVPSTEEVVP